jgi:hypothetical protein
MKKPFEGPTGARPDVRFLHPDGRVVDLPAKRWILANASRLTRRLGLSAFLSMIPAWLLRDVEEEGERADRSAPGASGEPSSAVILTLEHLKMWVPDGATSGPDFLEAFPGYVQQFQAACGLESLRRRGVLRVHVSVEDRLDRDVPRSIELNPVVLAELKQGGPPPRDGGEFLQRLGELSRLALQTDWADHEALADDDLARRPSVRSPGMASK